MVERLHLDLRYQVLIARVKLIFLFLPIPIFAFIVYWLMTSITDQSNTLVVLTEVSILYILVYMGVKFKSHLKYYNFLVNGLTSANY